MNKKQTACIIDLVFSLTLLILSLLSVYLFYNGTYVHIFGTYFFLPIFFLTIATFFGLVFGIIFTFNSAHGINENRD